MADNIIKKMREDRRSDVHKCDVEFQIVENGTVEKIRAHKVVLATVSEVFNQMFYGPLSQQNSGMRKGPEVVKIVDATPEIFQAFMELIYGEEEFLQKASLKFLLEILKLADKYDLEDKKTFISEILKSRMKFKTTKGNVFQALELIREYENLAGFEELCIELKKLCVFAAHGQIHRIFKFLNDHKNNPERETLIKELAYLPPVGTIDVQSWLRTLPKDNGGLDAEGQLLLYFRLEGVCHNCKHSVRNCKNGLSTELSIEKTLLPGARVMTYYGSRLGLVLSVVFEEVKVWFPDTEKVERLSKSAMIFAC